MDIQVILIVILFLLVILIILLIAVGVYLILVLKELRHTIFRINNILDTGDKITSSLVSPMVGLSAALGAFSQGFKVVKAVKKAISGEGGEDYEDA